MGTFYVVRHAKAGSRGHWTGDDRLRPLSQKGFKQAEALVSIFEKLRITGIFSSPYLRCMQTVEPLARAKGMPVKESPSLGEGHGLTGAMQLIGDPALDGVVLSTHGDIVWELVEELVKSHVVKPGDGGYEKGAIWVVDVVAGTPVSARFIEAP
ncbi:MAG TPA: phosphoglycerate mutase family protein [Candidatus Dormibacteraeota bacterium]|nr:phosphoglycerate mutase family protein [Candidatus Dormibacteraeota bacterium]